MKYIYNFSLGLILITLNYSYSFALGKGAYLKTDTLSGKVVMISVIFIISIGFFSAFSNEIKYFFKTKNKDFQKKVSLIKKDSKFFDKKMLSRLGKKIFLEYKECVKTNNLLNIRDKLTSNFLDKHINNSLKGNGINNNIEKKLSVLETNIIGIYEGRNKDSNIFLLEIHISNIYLTKNSDGETISPIIKRKKNENQGDYLTRINSNPSKIRFYITFMQENGDWKMDSINSNKDKALIEIVKYSNKN